MFEAIPFIKVSEAELDNHRQKALEYYATSLNLEAVVKDVLASGLNDSETNPFSQGIRIINIMRARSLPRGLAQGSSRRIMFSMSMRKDKDYFYALQGVSLDGINWIRVRHIPTVALSKEKESMGIEYLPDGELIVAGENVKAEQITFHHFIPEIDRKGRLEAFGVCRYINRKGKLDIQTASGTFENFYMGSKFALDYNFKEL